MSNPKFFQVWVEEKDGSAELNVVAGADPRTPKAMLDSTMNKKALKKYMEQVQAVLNGSQSAPVTPVNNHYLAKKTEVPWENADEDPQIELDGNFLAMYGRGAVSPITTGRDRGQTRTLGRRYESVIGRNERCGRAAHEDC